MTGKSWSEDHVTAIRARLSQGETQARIAQDLGCTPSNLSKRLKAADDPIGKRVYTLRCEGLAFDDISRDFNMEPGGSSTRRLYMRLVRYCERAGLEYPKVERAPTEPAPVVFDETVLFKIVFVLGRRAARGEDSDNDVIADTLHISDRDVKLHIAELRRRNVIANGIVPTQAGLQCAASMDAPVTVRDAVLLASVTAWSSSGPCETLRSLCDKLAYSRSALNLAIVRLRDGGLLAPRGNLHLRDRRHE
jgi:biotin operon repressor/transcriptional regulator with XRE-family HTH domain